MAYPDYAETMEEWWKMVDEKWDELTNMICVYHPNKENLFHENEMDITARDAEAARRFCAKRIAQENKITDIIDYAERLKNLRMAEELWTVFNYTWFGIPESIDCWEIPSFGRLCDLCSDFPIEEGVKVKDSGDFKLL